MSKSVLCLLRRCVAVRTITLPTRVQTSSRHLGSNSGVFSSISGYLLVQQRKTWNLDTGTGALLRPCVSALSAGRTGQSKGYCTKTGCPPCEEEYPPLPAYQTEPEPERRDAVHIVQVKGLMWSCSAQDLLTFFSDCRIRNGVNGIHLTVDRMGRRTGRAFLELEHGEDVCKALEKHRQYLGPRYVEVYEVTNSEAEEILQKAVHAPASDGVVRLRGLPFSCTEGDVTHFFSGLAIAENGITMVTDHRGRRSGEAFVRFHSQEEADQAQQRDREVIGNRYIEVFPSRAEEVFSSRTKRKSSVPQSGSQPGHTHNNRTAPAQSSAHSVHFIHMRGLPFQASGEDIVKFFLPLRVSRVLVECGPDGRPSGEAQAHFHSHQDAAAAMAKDRQHIGERYIELFLNSAPDCDRR